MIYISTGGIKNKIAYESVLELSQLTGLKHFELSGGDFDPNLEDNLNSLKDSYHLLVHNYFPPPKDGFVLNLASLNDEVLNKSRSFCENSIKLASQIGSKYYSFHAGFLIDPKIDQLGKAIKNDHVNDREKGKEVFVESIDHLSLIAKKYNIQLLIENNVLSKKNYENFNQVDPLLMTSADEVIEIMTILKGKAEFLLDVAHLKVSANSLNFSKEKFVEKTYNFIKAYHLSDNNGLEDSNKTFSKDPWFKNYLKKGLDYYSIEVYQYDKETILDQFNVVKNLL